MRDGTSSNGGERLVAATFQEPRMILNRQLEVVDKAMAIKRLAYVSGIR